MDEVQVNKAHRGKKSGTSAEKKQAKKIAKSGGQDLKGKNPKVVLIHPNNLKNSLLSSRLLQSPIQYALKKNLEGLQI